MSSPLFYVLLAIVILAIIASFAVNKKRVKPTTLAWASYAFIFAGIFFGAVQPVGYILMAVGGVLAIIDIIKNQPRADWKRILITALLALVLAAAIGWLGQYFYQSNLRNKNLNLNNVAYTQEAKICPDGSAVGRSGPKCEFDQCPEAKCPSDVCPISDSDSSADLITKTCTTEQRKGDVCAEIYAPVCATVAIQCIKAPCNPIQQTFSNVCEACHNSLVTAYTTGECQTAEKSAIEAIKKLFIAKYPKYAKTLTIRIDQETANHARGGIGFETGAPGGIWLAAKIDEKWQIVFDGNGGIPCTLSKYNFPAEMLKDCY